MKSSLTKALEDRGYNTLTPVQQAVADPDLAGQDLLVSAQTGSGKTVGFGLAIAPTILDGDVLGPAGKPLALVIAPTRELAMQVKRELGWLYANAGAQLSSTVGGMDFRDERRSLERGAHIVVSTPGRLCDHIKRGTIDLSEVRAIVLDEADEMLDLGFREDLEFILGEAPETRQTLMFSATVPPLIVKLAQSYQRNAQRITLQAKETAHADITYRAIQVAEHDGDKAIINLLRFYEAPNAIVFANTRAMVTRLTTRLSNRGFSVVALSGELTQQERSHALQAMRDGRARVCVATDVAARGIDLPQLELVIHAELPTNAETLMHRSGRTGRAGRKGVSAMIVPPKMRRRAQNLLKWGKLTATWDQPPSADDIMQRDEERLMTDPLWDETPSEAELAFADRLLAAQDPRKVAAAYYRLFVGRTSAPEDIEAFTPNPSDTSDRRERPKKERAPFGPSRWYRIDLGRAQKAEARWLLPMLCKAGDISKKDIGAIRIGEEETFVEIAEGRSAHFLNSIGAEMRLENQATIAELDGAPSQAPAAGKPAKRPGKPKTGQSRKNFDDAPTPRPAQRHSPKPKERSSDHKAEVAEPTNPKAEPKKKKRSKDRGPVGTGKPSKPDQKRQERRSKPKDDRKPRDKSKADTRAEGSKPARKSNPAASDTSRRFSPPGKPGKPRKAKAKGGSSPPRRRS